jgi:hypothetical protein
MPSRRPGRVTIEGNPARFAAGERYTLTITLTRSGMKRAGFQLAARFKDTGSQAGTLAAARVDAERVGIDTLAGIQYAGQKTAGSTVGEGGIARWALEWTAPSSGGPVIFHVAANAADGNDSADGDFIYTAIGEAAAAGGVRRDDGAEDRILGVPGSRNASDLQDLDRRRQPLRFRVGRTIR